LRVERINSSGSTIFLGDGVEVNSCNMKKDISGPFGLLAEVNGKDTTWLHLDRGGSPHTMTNASGLVIGQKTFTPYGTEMEPDTSGVAPDFAGEKKDQSGLIFLGTSYYDPYLARLLGPNGADNAYSFTNNPANLK